MLDRNSGAEITGFVYQSRLWDPPPSPPLPCASSSTRKRRESSDKQPTCDPVGAPPKNRRKNPRRPPPKVRENVKGNGGCGSFSMLKAQIRRMCGIIPVNCLICFFSWQPKRNPWNVYQNMRVCLGGPPDIEFPVFF